MGRIGNRLRALEGRTPPEPCPLCSGWLAAYISGRLDTLTRDGLPADEYQRAEYLERVREEEKNGGACPACSRAPLEIRVGGAEPWGA